MKRLGTLVLGVIMSLGLMPRATASDTVNVSITATPSTGKPSHLVTFSGSATSSSGAAVASWVWNYGDGIWCYGPSNYCPLFGGTHYFPNIKVYSVSLTVTDNLGTVGTAAVTVTTSNTTTLFDGPAELPRVYINTAMSNTPAPGSTILVNAGSSVQTALNSANCGDTIQLQAGATFSGSLKFPAKSCDSGHWVIVRTSAPDSALPAEGQRITPCYAGVASLPGRPAYPCTTPNDVMAKIVSSSSTGPVVFATGANHYRLIGLEITRTDTPGIVYELVSGDTGGSANNIILDRVWVHGVAHEETKSGFLLGGMSYASAIDSYFTDMHCTSKSGACTDAFAVGGGIGDPLGPFKIVDNFLEASGENIIFGGAAALTTPVDIQITKNHLFKPLTWLLGQAGYVGGADGSPFMVKNLLELKNAQRVLVDSNIMEYSWGGFSQSGFALLVTPKNPGGTGPCTVCQVTDVTIRYNSISHVGSGFQIANAVSDFGGIAVDGERYSIHDITIDDMDSVKYNGQGEFAQVSVSAGAPLLQNVTINHITAFPVQHFLIVGDMVATSGPMKNFVLSNSIITAGVYPVWSTGGIGNCAIHDVPITTMTACFSNYSFTNNAIIAPGSSYPPSAWPANNFFPSSIDAVGFVDYSGGNYALLSTSPYHNAGTDGKDVGADIVGLRSALVGVN